MLLAKDSKFRLVIVTTACLLLGLLLSRYGWFTLPSNVVTEARVTNSPVIDQLGSNLLAWSEPSSSRGMDFTNGVIQTALDQIMRGSVLGGAFSARTKHSKKVVAAIDSLASCGPIAVPYISPWLISGSNVLFSVFTVSDLTTLTNKVVSSDTPPAITEFPFPLNSRFAMLQALVAIKDSSAQNEMIQFIESTRSIVELVLASIMLEEISPGRFRDRIAKAGLNLNQDTALTTTGDYQGLANLDYLLVFFQRFNPVGLSSNHKLPWLTAEGRVNMPLLLKSLQISKETALEDMKRLFSDDRLRNTMDRVAIVALAFDLVGTYSAADELIKRAVQDDSIPELIRLQMIHSLRGYNHFTQTTKSLEPEIRASSIALLEGLLGHEQGLTKSLVYVVKDSIGFLKSQMESEN